MTIKEFASLCGCSTQTLRYYDKIDLLKPVKVDPWSSYRYYTKTQAIDFVKIKSFQQADFTIEEIKVLLALPDQKVQDAFDRKIEEQTQKLERIKEIKRSYLNEKSSMEKLVQNLSDYLLYAVSDFELLREFGLSPEDGPDVIAKLRDYIERITLENLPTEPDVRLVVDDQVICGADRIADIFADLKEKGYDNTVLLGDENVGVDEGFTVENSEIIWERHGWNYVYEFLDDIPPMHKDYQYCLSFQLTEDKYKEELTFPLFMIAAMLPRVDAEKLKLGCSVEHSHDGQNHFTLLRRDQ